MLKTLSAFAVLAFIAAAPASAQTMPSHPSPTAPRAPAVSPSAATDQFSSEQAAKAHCPGDAIVWANLGGSKAYHTSGDRYYGKTRHGAFMCQKEADQTGYHAAGRRPTKAAAKSAPPKTTH